MPDRLTPDQREAEALGLLRDINARQMQMDERATRERAEIMKELGAISGRQVDVIDRILPKKKKRKEGPLEFVAIALVIVIVIVFFALRGG